MTDLDASAFATGTLPAWATLLCAGAAAWLLAGGDRGARRVRLVFAGDAVAHCDRGLLGSPSGFASLLERLRSRYHWIGSIGGPGGKGWWCLLGGSLIGVLGASWIPPVIGAIAVPVTGKWLRKQRRRRETERRAEAVVELCTAVSGELRAGCPPDRALLAAGGSLSRGPGEGGSAVLAAARFGGSVPEALRAAAHTPGAEGLRGVAACWQVSIEGGAGLADALDRVGNALRAELDQREDLRAQLAGPRATAVALALLPIFGLLLGTAMGAEPLKVLLHTPAGIGCLATGALLEWAGLAWVSRLVRGVENGSTGSGGLEVEQTDGPRRGPTPASVAGGGAAHPRVGSWYG